MEYLFEKDGRMREKYISGTNIIPYCQDDFKKMMKEMGDEQIEWSKNFSSAICQIAYNFMQELIVRPSSAAVKFQNPLEAFNHLMRNIRIKFPQLVNQAQTLSSEFMSIWSKEDEKAKRSSEKQKYDQKNNLVQQKQKKQQSRKKQSKHQRQRFVQIDLEKSDLNIFEDQDLEKLLDYLSEDEYSKQ